MKTSSTPLHTILDNEIFSIVDEYQIPEREPYFEQIPSVLHPIVRTALERAFPSGIYSHQAKGIDLLLDNKDICLATPTASGKSLVFMSYAANLLLQTPNARILALYPAKALIRDQLEKWKTFLVPLNLPVGYIDGAVRTTERAAILRRSKVVLMTPDVAHAWMMSNLSNQDVASFLSAVSLLVLDEAHVYDGVFGTNMAFFLRRLQCVAPLRNIVSSTATIGDPVGFIEKLTGRPPILISKDDDGSPSSTKTIFLLRSSDGSIDNFVNLITSLPSLKLGPFIAFVDSRKMVEQIVAIAKRSCIPERDLLRDIVTTGDTLIDDLLEDKTSLFRSLGILPYRAGYEEDDRNEIQRALAEGRLSGVVSTSALELGIDIGEISIVVLLGVPPSVKAFWQRFGRGGRKGNGYCILLDDCNAIEAGGLSSYLNRTPEPCWLYLENRFIQYTHALCAALGKIEYPDYNQKPLETLPDDFLHFMNNEIFPRETIPNDLYPLKQRAVNGPHYEFPLRSGVEKNLSISENSGYSMTRLGGVSFSQALREAYPGAIYYYMACPYRVVYFNYRLGEIRVKKEKRWTTRPILQNMVFPKMDKGVLALRKSKSGFLIEANLQVSERIIGFAEQRGPNSASHLYEQGNFYSQRPITRFFETTGVCWFFDDRRFQSEPLANLILRAFCYICGIQERDLGLGTFQARSCQFWDQPTHGLCIYDAVNGSLRLTKQLFEKFEEILATLDLGHFLLDEVDDELCHAVRLFKNEILTTAIMNVNDGVILVPPAENDWVTVICPGEKGMYIDGNNEEVKVLGYRFTTKGMVYHLEPSGNSTSWVVKIENVVPLYGVTKVEMYNINTGETAPA